MFQKAEISICAPKPGANAFKRLAFMAIQNPCDLSGLNSLHHYNDVDQTGEKRPIWTQYGPPYAICVDWHSRN